MNFSQAFDLTLKDCGITGKSIADKSGVSQQMISNFRRGQQRIYTDSLEKIIKALPQKAQNYFYSLLLKQSVRDRCPTALELISEMNPFELAELLNAIAASIVEQYKNDYPHRKK